ncbi:hypothetical protein H8I91_01450 [Serratia fonticola]|uniref:hypothetical protein n=1 Tax=Serratia fonticola TaxID=47917 RepID=UPI001645E1BD|nr:hypothetical protein [Serratia fonticola]MBC3248922.1 hypothetical protein [Serratia fonticola]
MENDLMPNFWKLSHGAQSQGFTFQDMVECIDEKLVYIHRDTAAKGISYVTQAVNFANAPIGDYFYLTHGNLGIYLLGQFTGPVNYFTKYGDGWMDRPFRLILKAINQEKYNGVDKWWAPNHNSTFVEVPHHEYDMFEQEILEPYFNTKLDIFYQE